MYSRKKVYLMALQHNTSPEKVSLEDYFALLDEHCAYFKTVPGGGLGWFAHIYTDDQEPGYGIYDYNGKMKFAFEPRTSC